MGHTSQCARNLCGTQSPAEMADHDDPERVVGNQLAQDTGLAGQHPGSPVRWNTAIASGHPGSALPDQLWRGQPAVATYLAANGRTSPHEAAGDRRRPHAQGQLRLNQGPFLQVKVTVAFRHMQLSPIWKCCTCALNPPWPILSRTLRKGG